MKLFPKLRILRANVSLISQMTLKSSIEVNSGKQIALSPAAHYRVRVSPCLGNLVCLALIPSENENTPVILTKGR